MSEAEPPPERPSPEAPPIRIPPNLGRWAPAVTVEPGEFVPYVGPDPVLSARPGLRLVVAAMVTASISVPAMVLALRQAALERQVRVGYTPVVVAGPGTPPSLVPLIQSWVGNPWQVTNSPALLRAVHDNAGQLAAISRLWVVASIVTLVLGLTWCSSRRPAALLLRGGEKLVESPMKQVVPRPLHLLTYALFVLGFSGTVNLFATKGHTPDQLAVAYTGYALGAALWAAGLLSTIAWVVLANRSHAARLVASEGAQADPEDVPFVNPLPDSVSVVSGEPDGLLWVLTTAGLVLVGIAGAAGVLIARADLAKYGDATSMGALTAWAVILALAVSCGVQRHRDHQTTTGG